MTAILYDVKIGIPLKFQNAFGKYDPFFGTPFMFFNILQCHKVPSI